MFKDIDWKDVGERCLKTFIEAFLTYAVTALSGVTYGDGGLKSSITTGAIICAVCTAFTAVINTVLLPVFRSSKDKGSDTVC